VKGCAWAPGDSEDNIRNDVAALKNSPYVRNEIPVIGYVLSVETGELKEVKYVTSQSSAIIIFPRNDWVKCVVKWKIGSIHT